MLQFEMKTPANKTVHLIINDEGVIKSCFVPVSEFNLGYLNGEGIKHLLGESKNFAHFSDPETAFRFIHRLTPLTFKEQETYNRTERKAFVKKYFC